jgi:hypothetical protein
MTIMGATMKKIIIAMLAVMSLVWSSKGYSQNPSDYLVCQDIGAFKKYGCACGTGAGLLVPVDHFGEDHHDTSCTVIYHSMTQRMGIDVEVTQHSGNDSDKWLLHELDAEFRNYYGIPGDSYAVVPIDGNTVLEFGSAGWDYRWINGNNVIKIDYQDAQMTKPEPLEIVKAYLAKHPSTLSPLTLSGLRSTENKTTWIKDEMERRLWLCDKWFYQLQLKKADEKEVYKESVKSMNIFLDYREKYYGVKASDEKNLLTSYLSANNGTSIKAKLTEYKDWWSANKDKGINL